MSSLKELSKEEYILKGNPACAGCGATISIRLLYKALGNKIFFVLPACCTTVIQGPYPYASFASPMLNIVFEGTAAAASGIVAALKKKGEKDIIVVGWAGDGGTADIGIQALSGAAERNTNFIYVCYDNEAYGNTGMQRSGATPYGAWTTTTPTGKREHKKNIPMIMAAHGIPYIATVTPAYPMDFIAKLRKAEKIEGTRYIHILSPCPPGWRFPTEKTIEISRLAVQTGMWVLYEIEYGRFKLSSPSAPLIDKSKRRNVEEYLRQQGRFSHLTAEDIIEIQRWIDSAWENYKKLQADCI
jgi:pyruvate ferredoxin oxidoreductase beta subunit